MKQERIPLSTGITLNVATAGREGKPPVILLHGFPESHRTWRGIVPLLEDRYHLVMPDQRGFAGSDKPENIGAYATDRAIADVYALADALKIKRFTLVGHDWGGAVAWAAAVRGDPRIERLAVINSPHPQIFQRSLVDDPDQRLASQYMNRFRDPRMVDAIRAMGFDTFFEKSFGVHVDTSIIPPEERATYIEQWSAPGAIAAMLAWYKAGRMVIPEPGERAQVPDWAEADFPMMHLPVLVIWGMRDPALLPCQLDGLDALADPLTITRIEEAGHFVPWERPEPVADALREFIPG